LEFATERGKIYLLMVNDFGRVEPLITHRLWAGEETATYKLQPATCNFFPIFTLPNILNL